MNMYVSKRIRSATELKSISITNALKKLGFQPFKVGSTTSVRGFRGKGSGDFKVQKHQSGYFIVEVFGSDIDVINEKYGDMVKGLRTAGFNANPYFLYNSFSVATEDNPVPSGLSKPNEDNVGAI